LDAEAAPDFPLLLDTTVYIDRSRGKLPRPILARIRAAQHRIYHCGLVCAELAISLGLLTPNHPRTPTTSAPILAHLDHMVSHRGVSPSAAAWTEAAVVAGILARTQGLAIDKGQFSEAQRCCQRGRRRELLLDALLYFTAIEHDFLLVSGNVRDLDILLQVRPSPNVLLYRPAGWVSAAAHSS
jgi:predicted nucleic acid-binding protein